MSCPNPVPIDRTLPSAEAPPIRSATQPRPASVRWPLWYNAIAWTAVLAYAIFLSVNMTVIAGGSDSSGYLNSARLFAEGQWQTVLRVPPEFGAPAEINRSHFSPQGFNLFSDNFQLSPTYPTGLPLHFALAARLFGWEVGPFLVQLAAALGAVWLCYRAARELGAGQALSAAGAAVLATFPVFIFASVQTLSDTLATTWTLATIVCALKARRSDAWSLGCGMALAIAVLVRPTNLLLAPGLVVLLGWNLRRLAFFVLGGLPGAGWLGFYNHTLYGGALKSGYGDIFATFALGYGRPTAVHFAKWLALMLPTVVLAAPLALAAHRHGRGREAIGLGLIFAAIVGLYLFYNVSHDVWWCLRFILPAIAALILLAVLGLDTLAHARLPEWRRRFQIGAAAILIACGGAGAWYWVSHLHILLVPGYERAYANAARVVQERLPDNAIVVCSVFSGTLYYYTELPALVYDHLTPAEFAAYVERAKRGNRPIYAVIFDIEEDDVLRNRCPGAWTRIAAVEKIGIWQLQ